MLFAPGGTGAVGIALKLARMATGRFKTLSMWDSFHGASLDTISVGGEAIFRQDIGPLLPGTEHVPPPDAQHCPWDCRGTCSLKCAEYVEYVLDKEGDIGAVIAETVRSTPFIPPKDYWRIIREGPATATGRCSFSTRYRTAWGAPERCSPASTTTSCRTCW